MVLAQVIWMKGDSLLAAIGLVSLRRGILRLYLFWELFYSFTGVFLSLLIDGQLKINVCQHLVKVFKLLARGCFAKDLAD
jgi:hypothetical protein